MSERLAPNPPVSVRRTRLADAALAWLVSERRPVVTPYDLFQQLRALFAPEHRKQLYLRHDTPGTDDLRKVTRNLVETAGLTTDPDYGRNLYRVLPVGEAAAEEVTALANPFGYISHLSAMQRWGLTERRPEALYLTMPPAAAASDLIAARMAEDYAATDPVLRGLLPKLHFLRPPKVVRRRTISVFETKQLGQWLRVQDSYARLATVGQAFVDMVERPQYCGGMAHVLDVWQRHAPIFREEIIEALEGVGTPIAKVRAGYLLDERLGIGDDARVQGWVRFAQRGSSRVLDPKKPFKSDHSEKWMLSLNV